MRILLQRISRASVAVDKQTIGEAGRGLLLFVGFGHEDTPEKLARCRRENS